MMTIPTDATTVIGGSDRTETLIAAAIAFAFGVGLVFTMGFSQPSAIHNAAHDTRHALGFPCH